MLVLCCRDGPPEKLVEVPVWGDPIAHLHTTGITENISAINDGWCTSITRQLNEAKHRFVASTPASASSKLGDVARAVTPDAASAQIAFPSSDESA